MADGRLASAAYETAAEAAAIGERFGDADLTWLARDEQGRALIKQGRVAEGLRLVDEVLVAATAGELSPIVTGIVYCNTIAFCQDAYELRHAREWTEALTAMVRAPAGDGRPQRPLPGAPGGDHAAAGRLGGGAGRGAARRRALHARES